MQDHIPRGSTAHSVLGLLTSTINQDIAPQAFPQTILLKDMRVTHRQLRDRQECHLLEARWKGSREKGLVRVDIECSQRAADHCKAL